MIWKEDSFPAAGMRKDSMAREPVTDEDSSKVNKKDWIRTVTLEKGERGYVYRFWTTWKFNHNESVETPPSLANMHHFYSGHLQKENHCFLQNGSFSSRLTREKTIFEQMMSYACM